MQKVLMTPKLEKFLRDKKVLIKFKKNTINSGFSTDWTMHNIIAAFNWDDTPEGIDFWMEINDEFEKL